MSVDVAEMLEGFEAPFDLKGTVEGLLASVPDRYLASLKRVVITTSQGLSGKMKRKVHRYRSGERGRYANAAGFYQPRGGTQEAVIVLLADNLVKGWPRWTFRFRLCCETVLAQTLYHELGHHVHRTQRPSRKDPEILANDWARRFRKNHFRTRHRYLFLFATLGSCIPVAGEVGKTTITRKTECVKGSAEGELDTLLGRDRIH